MVNIIRQEIADYLNNTTKKTGNQISLKKDKIESLKEYKQTLIKSAVTNKTKKTK